jgi:hypothetical protein
MAVFLRPDRGSVATRSIHPDFAPGVVTHQLVSDKYCLSLVASSYDQILLDKDGEPIKDGLLKSGQRATLNLGRLKADKYHLMLIANPELARMAYIGGPILLEPYEAERLEYTLKVERQIDLAKLTYLFRIYLVD